MALEPCNVRVGELEIMWRWGSTVLEATRHGERVAILVSTDMDEQLALLAAFKKPDDKLHAALGMCVGSGKDRTCILRWDFRSSRPYVAVYQ